jgi:hypothetical protein
MMQEDEQGWLFTSQRACTGCVDDHALQAAIRAAEATCDFCGNSPAAELDILLKLRGW